MPIYTGTNGFDLKQMDGADVNLAWTMYGLDGDDIMYAGVLADTLYGGNGDDLLVGRAGNDTIYGDAGDDILRGGAGNDTLNGGSGSNQLHGEDGNDLIYGTANDSISGGAGADTVWCSNSYVEGGDGNDIIHADATGGILYGDAGADTFYLNGNAWAYGGDDNDRFYGGGEGGSIIEGNAGADTFYEVSTLSYGNYFLGGAGNDIYYISYAGTQIEELANEGYDIVRSSLSIELGDNLEAGQLEGSANVYASGNELANNLQGNSGNNSLSGGAGVDTLNGGDGDDRIIGGVGNDLLRGGTGADQFVVYNESVGAAVLETDTVYDFATAEGDIIDLSQIDAIPGGANDAFTLVSSFSKAAGEMTLTFAGGTTTLRLDLNGDGKVDYQMKINGDVTGDSGGWLL